MMGIAKEKEWQREMMKWKQRKGKLLEKGGNYKLIKEGRNAAKKVYVKKEVRKGKKRKVMGIVKKKDCDIKRTAMRIQKKTKVDGNRGFKKKEKK